MAASPREGREKKRARGVKNDEEGSRGPVSFRFSGRKVEKRWAVGGTLREVMMSRGGQK